MTTGRRSFITVALPPTPVKVRNTTSPSLKDSSSSRDCYPLLIMPPVRSKEHLRLAAEILRGGLPTPVPCDYCFLKGLSCVAMPEVDGKLLKCSECTRLGHPCVNMSWKSLDKTREEYKAKVEADEQLLSEVIARLLRNKKILKQAEERARKKAVCLANELREAGESVDAEALASNCPAADAQVGYSPAMWTIQGFLENLTDPLDSSQGPTF